MALLDLATGSLVADPAEVATVLEPTADAARSPPPPPAMPGRSPSAFRCSATGAASASPCCSASGTASTARSGRSAI